MIKQPMAKKSLGQHFLKDAAAIQHIIDLARIDENDQVMEIGPGPGALTSLLRNMKWQKLCLLEKDDTFAAMHASMAQENLCVQNMDALTFPWQELEGDWIILGNLPYNVASPMMWDIVSQVPHLKRAVFMIQKEVAERIRAGTGTKAYGALSAWIQSYCTPRKGFVLGPHAFNPPPKVDSEVIVLTPLPPHLHPADPVRLAQLIKICFQQRRKQLNGILLRALPEYYNPEILNKLEISLQARPENLSSADFQRLCAALFPQKSASAS